jgi:cationic amino acid transporter 3
LYPFAEVNRPDLDLVYRTKFARAAFVCEMFGKLTARLNRRKQYSSEQDTDSKLSRCLNTIDLTLLGVGSTLGVGVYVLAGAVARDTAGPSVILSFVIAGFASALSGLCYAEFGARVPKAGSAYVYSYVTVGELAAFVIGWNLVLEYVIGTASVARGYSGYLDSLLNNTMKNTFKEHMPMNASFLAEYPDWTAARITLVLACVLSVGVQESSRFNNIFTLLNLSVVIFVVAAGSTKANLENWNVSDSSAMEGTVGEVEKDDSVKLGAGGFFPFGVSGMLSGAATCFYGFVGFDAIATTGEETRNPQRSIPIAIVVSLIIVCFGYIGISGVLTLMVPYYLQDADAPLPHAFRLVGLPEAAWVVALGALFGLSTSLLGAMFPLPRVIYAMANDGLLPRFLGTVHNTFQTPFIATILAGTLSAVMALLFDLSQLVDMMSIGTLMAYTMVSLSVLLLRYRCTGIGQASDYTPLCTQDPFETDDVEELFPKHSATAKMVFTRKEYMRQMLNLDGDTIPNPLSSHVASHSAILIALLSVPLSIVSQLEPTWYHKIGLAFVILKIIICIIVLMRQPSDVSRLSFKVPLVPLIPSLSIMINVFLTTKLSGQTWVRFAVWMIIGLIIYVAYGIKNSSEEYRMRGEVPPEQKDASSNKPSTSR